MDSSALLFISRLRFQPESKYLFSPPKRKITATDASKMINGESPTFDQNIQMMNEDNHSLQHQNRKPRHTIVTLFPNSQTNQLTVAPDDPISQSNEKKPEDNDLLPTPLQQFEVNRPSPDKSSFSAEQLSLTEACLCPQTPTSVFEAFRDQFGLPLNDLDTECRTHRQSASWQLCVSLPSEMERARFHSEIVQQFNAFNTSESRSDNE
ncbi:hypothetical protein BLNAU_17479 [Blattamonas nauphoetae]|uniref:Uncharacterized protein n=1 Tax=Blattamonas nauphoetae TaxID=2049346 RepID=A0ABQ9X9L9_9EUKA|nr:hypothetical protein BLNAU_17479 [Blattamonas nauphoetae]